MFIDVVPNGRSAPAVLLRESFREGRKVHKRTIANLSQMPPALIDGLRALLAGGVFHWTARRIEAHVKLRMLALQMQRSAEIRTGLPWARIAHALTALKAVRYASQGRTIVQRAKIGAELGDLLKKLGIPILKQILLLAETAARPTAA